MSKLYKPLKRSQIQQTRRGPILWTPLSLGRPKHKKTTDLQVRLFVTNLMLCIKFYSQSIIRLYKISKDLFKTQTQRTFLDPVSGTSENSKTTDLQVRLFVANLMLCIKFIHTFYYE